MVAQAGLLAKYPIVYLSADWLIAPHTSQNRYKGLLFSIVAFISIIPNISALVFEKKKTEFCNEKNSKSIKVNVKQSHTTLGEMP